MYELPWVCVWICLPRTWQRLLYSQDAAIKIHHVNRDYTKSKTEFKFQLTQIYCFCDASKKFAYDKRVYLSTNVFYVYHYVFHTN